MYYFDHAPPHFHAEYGDDEIVVAISPIAITDGDAPARVKSLVLEWAALHQQELLDNWNRCQLPVAPNTIDPLVKICSTESHRSKSRVMAGCGFGSTMG
jgi:hypothetical protein